MKKKAKSPLNIFLLKRHFHRIGGLEKYSLAMTKAFAELGHNIHILCETPPANFEHYKNVKIEIIKTQIPINLYKIHYFNQSCKKRLEYSDYDIAFGFDRTGLQTHIRAGNGVHRAFLDIRKKIEPFWKRLSFKINPLHRLLLAIEKSSFENSKLKKLYTNSHMVKQQVLQHYSIDPKRIEVVHNGVEWMKMQSDFDHFKEEKAKHLKELGLSGKDYQFVFVGSGFHRKGLEVLLRALGSVKKPFHLSVIGQDKNTKYFRNLAQNLRIAAKVTFFGLQPSVTKFYQLADCCVIPSLYDPFANVTVEALAMGLFVVTTKTNGGCEIISNSNGYIVDSAKSVEDLTRGLNIAMKHPKTIESAKAIRDSVAYLDFPNQLNQMIDSCLLSPD